MSLFNLRDEKIKIEGGKVILTKVKEIRITDNDNIEELENKLKTELRNIIKNVKHLKERAEETKEILKEIKRQKEEAGSIKGPTS